MSYSEEWCEERIYVSDHSMVEFYKLCREHAVLLKCKLEDEPYYKELSEVDINTDFCEKIFL